MVFLQVHDSVPRQGGALWHRVGQGGRLQPPHRNLRVWLRQLGNDQDGPRPQPHTQGQSPFIISRGIWKSFDLMNKTRKNNCYCEQSKNKVLAHLNKVLAKVYVYSFNIGQSSTCCLGVHWHKCILWVNLVCKIIKETKCFDCTASLHCYLCAVYIYSKYITSFKS